MPPVLPSEQPAVIAVLPVRRVGKALAFYAALGFQVQAHDAGYGLVLHRGREVFHVRLKPDLDPEENPASVYVHVAEADAWHEAWQGVVAALGAVEDEPWGMREFSFYDPDGNLIRVGHNR